MPDENNMHSSKKVVLDLDGLGYRPEPDDGQTAPRAGKASKKVELDLGPDAAGLEAPKEGASAPRQEAQTDANAPETAAEGKEPVSEPDPAKMPAAPKGRIGKKAALAACAVCGIGAAAIVIGVTMGTLAAQTQVKANDIPSAEQAQSGNNEASAFQDQDATTLPAQGGEAIATGEAVASAGSAAQPASETCEHDWQPEATERDVDATFEEVDVPATYEEVTEYHTLCNVCYEQIDGKVAEHRAATGHKGATKNVPVKVNRLKTEAHKETRQAAPAHKERVWTKEKCSKCGAERDVEEHVETVE